MSKGELTFCTFRWQSRQSGRQHVNHLWKMSSLWTVKEPLLTAVRTTEFLLHYASWWWRAAKMASTRERTSQGHTSTWTVFVESASKNCFYEQSFIFNSIANTSGNICISDLCKPVLGAASHTGGILWISCHLLGSMHLTPAEGSKRGGANRKPQE